MALQIVLAWSKECEEELLGMGFRLAHVYMKPISAAGGTKEEVVKGDHEILGMRNRPYQFVTTSFWGAGPD